jgi:hypothetical protein
VAETQEALGLEQNTVSLQSNLARNYLALNRPDDARRAFDQAQSRNLDGGNLRLWMYYLAFFRRDVEQMKQQLVWAAGKPGDEDPLLSAQSDTEGYYGRLAKAQDFSRRAADSAVRADSKETAALWEVNAALREAEFGNTAEAKQLIASALSLAPGRDVRLLAALTSARVGETVRAKAMIEDLERNNPSNTVLKLYWLPTLKAAIELNQGHSAEALVLLEAAAPYELGEPPPFELGSMYPAFLRGQVYLALGNGAAAAAEFQKLLDHPGIVLNAVTGALAHLELGRAYAMSGDRTKAQSAYKDLLTLWKDADPDIPILREAKAEYAKLQ